MGFPKGASIPFAKLQLAAEFKLRSRFKLIVREFRRRKRERCAWMSGK